MKVITTEKKPIKLWLDDIEDGALAQAKNLANLPFVFKHIAIMPDSHQGYGMPIGGVMATKGVVVPNAVGVDIGCFSGDTKVPLLNGSEKTLKELTKEKKPFYVYSVNNNKEITACLAISRKTRKNAEVMKVFLDNGEFIECTLDHKFMLRDGSYCEAKDLSIGESLMPLCKKYDKDNYESIYNPKTKTYQRTHWLLARTGVLGEVPVYKNQKTIIHHSDFKQNNNDPENLKFMGNKDHSKYHRSVAERNTHWQSKEFEEKRIASIKNKIKTDKKFLKQKQEQGKENIVKYMKENKDKFLDKVKDNGKRGTKYLIKYNKSKKGREKSSENGKKYGFGKKLNNHKVVKIIMVRKKKDVYCLTVDKYHNFALSAGVFVHNCGMCAVKTNLNYIDIDVIKKIMGEIRKVVPVGFNKHKEYQDEAGLPGGFDNIVKSIVFEEYANALKSLGTLGGGNHFIEIQKGSDGFIWIMIHSGSRNLGFKVAKHYNDLAQKLNTKWFSDVPPFKGQDGLAFLPLDTEEGQLYLKEMNYCVGFALANRKLMMDRVLDIFRLEMDMGIDGLPFTVDPMINIAHNYARMEHHFGQDVMVHRKGATSARKGQMGIIPGSQGTKSYIVKGKGNKESFESCSHGAGRKMGRKQAQKTLDLQEEIKKLNDQGIVHGIRNVKDLDEASGAYKDINVVMENQKDLVDVVVELIPLGVIKG